MSYKESVIADTPTAFYLFGDNNTHEIDTDLDILPLSFFGDDSDEIFIEDLSGYNNHAILNKKANIVLPIISNTNSSIEIESDINILYPLLPIWGNSQNLFSFSIEFWLYEYGVLDESIIFGPKDSNGPLKKNGIYLQDGRITFSVGNGTGNSEPDNYMTISHQIVDRTVAHHYVCCYTPTGLSITVDGGIWFESVNQAVQQNKWLHDLIGFITECSSDSFIVDGLAIYQKQLSDKTINRHYQDSISTINESDIVSRYNGILFPVDNNKSTLNYSMQQPNKYGRWNTYSQNNLLEDAGTLTLKKIPPAALSEKTETYSDGLVLHDNQYLSINNFNLHIGLVEGGLSGKFLLNENHNIASEFCLFFIESNDDYIMVLHDTNKNIILRHKYLDSVSQEYVEVDTIAGPAVYSWSDILLVWSEKTFTLYYNDDVVQYSSVDTKPFQLSTASNLDIGSMDRSSAFFNSTIKNINCYNSMPLLDDIDTISNYTLLLDSNLNVSQTGYAIFYIDLSGLYEMKEARINYAPVNSKTLIEFSLDNILYTECIDGMYLPGFVNPTDMGADIPSGYIKVTLTTSDSYFDIPVLYYTRLFIYSNTIIDNNQFNMNMIPYGEYHTGQYSKDIISKYNDNGIKFYNGYMISDTITETDVTLDHTRYGIVEAPKSAKTVELFIKHNEIPSNQTYLYTDGYSITTDGSSISATGFTDIYINGVLETNPTVPNMNEWIHIVATAENAGSNRINIITNPRLTNNADTWSGLSDTTISRVLDTVPYGEYSVQMESTDHNGNLGIEFNPGVYYSAQENTDYTASIFLKTESVPRDPNFILSFYDTDKVLISEHKSDHAEDCTVWTPFVARATSPEGTEYIGFTVIYKKSSVGEKHYAANPLLEQASMPYPYFDGEFSNAQWSGTPDNSQSILNLGINLTKSNIYINSDSIEFDYPSVSYTNIALYPDTFDESMAKANFNSYLGNNILTLPSGDWNVLYEDDLYIDFPFGAGYPEIPIITDLAPEAISAAWTIFSSE